MVPIRRLTLAALALAAGLVTVGAARAGPLASWLNPCSAPSPSYSPFRYWAPRLARVYDCIHGPRLSVYAPDRHPESRPLPDDVQDLLAAETELALECMNPHQLARATMTRVLSGPKPERRLEAQAECRALEAHVIQQPLGRQCDDGLDAE